MLIIEITPSFADSVTRSGVSQKTGREYTMHEQYGYAYMGDHYPQKIRFRLPDGMTPYAVGFYSLHETSFSVGKFDSLSVSSLVLVPLDNDTKLPAKK